MILFLWLVWHFSVFHPQAAHLTDFMTLPYPSAVGSKCALGPPVHEFMTMPLLLLFAYSQAVCSSTQYVLISPLRYRVSMSVLPQFS